MHYALALLPATHLPTVSLHTQTRPRHTHMGLYNLQGSYFAHCFRKSYMSMNVHTCVRARTHTHTYWACTTCSDIGSCFSHCFHKVYMCMNCTRLCTHTWTHTHTDWACTTCSDFGFLFLTLSLQSVHVHECTHMCTHTCMCTHKHRLGLYHLQ